MPIFDCDNCNARFHEEGWTREVEACDPDGDDECLTLCRDCPLPEGYALNEDNNDPGPSTWLPATNLAVDPESRPEWSSSDLPRCSKC